MELWAGEGWRCCWEKGMGLGGVLYIFLFPCADARKKRGVGRCNGQELGTEQSFGEEVWRCVELWIGGGRGGVYCIVLWTREGGGV